MPALSLHKPATYQDLFGLPPNLVGEIVRGILHTHPRPAPKHARSSSALGGKLHPSFDDNSSGPGGWWILDEPELHLDNDILVPNLAGWRREQMPRLPEAAWFELAPDWVCAVLSPGTMRFDRIEKMPIYAASGVKHIWLIDPELRILEAFANHDSRWTLIATHADQEQIRVPPFAAVAIDLGGLWA